MANQIANLTVAGRLSYPVFTYAEALERNTKSQYAKKPEQVAPEYNILLEQAALDKTVKYLLDVYVPELRELIKTDKRLEKMTPKHIDMIAKKIEGKDYDTIAPYLPLRAVPEKTQDMAPEAVAMLKVVGNRQQDLELKAVVRGEDELLIPDNDILDYPVIRPLKETVHEIYAGAVVGTTLNFYGYMSGANPGLGAGGPKLVFKSDADRFGGGVALDEDALFADE